MAQTHWQPWEIAMLRKYASLLNAEDIGLLIGRTKYAVLHRASLLRISLQKRGDMHPSRKYSCEDAELARQLHAAGIRPRDIAEKLGIKVISLGNFLY